MRRRVFIGPGEVAGYYTQLEPGLRACGWDVMRVDLTPDARRYPIGRQPLAARVAFALQRRAARSTGLTRTVASKLNSLALFALFFRALLSCDVFLYAFGATITWRPEWELRLLRRMGKRIICMFHGSDSRPPFLDGQTMAADRGVSIDQCVAFAAQRRANIALLSRYAHIMVDSPLAAHFHVSRCVNVLAIGIPFAQRAVDDAPLTQRSATRILHSPSHPETKGTPLVRRAIESLRARGHDIDYVEITGQPHDVVMRELRSCDLVVDQAYSDTPMAGFATEAAGFGRAVVVGTLGVEQFERWIRPDDLPPTRCVVPERIEDAIAELLDDPVSRDALGARARTFVTSHRDPAVVAARFIRLFTGDVPDEWWFDPADVTYTGGCGSPAVIRRTIRAVVEQRGPAALQLEDKPSLRDAIIRFGYDEGPVPTSTAPVHHTDAVSAPFPS